MRARVFLQSLLEQLPPDDPDYIYNMGCLLYQEGKYEEACRKFTSAMQVLGYLPGTPPEMTLLHSGGQALAAICITCEALTRLTTDVCLHQRCPTTSPCATTA